MTREKTTFCLIALLSAAQMHAQSGSWNRMNYFEGHWTGTGSGESGTSAVQREYRYILGGTYLHLASTSTYAPREKSPKGEVHEEWGIFSHDRKRNVVVLRQFSIEGFVSQYVLDTLQSDSTTLVFVTESIENIPVGWKARETYRMIGDKEFIETFELAPPGGEFTVYAENRLKR